MKLDLKDIEFIINVMNEMKFTVKGSDIDYIYELKTKLIVEKSKIEGA